MDNTVANSVSKHSALSKRTIILVITIILVLVLVLVYIILRKSGPYMTQDEYMSKFGIMDLYSYDSIKLAKQAEILDEALDSERWITLVFDGYQIEFSPDMLLANIKITSPKYTLGRLGIGIGSTVQDVMNAYRNQKEVKDTKQNVIGYIDGSEGNASDDSHKPWIFFELNDKSCVERIIICPSGIL